jgi:hypothetical protein
VTTTGERGDWRPLSQRDISSTDTLLEGVPRHLVSSLAKWITRYLRERPALTERVALQMRVPLEVPDPQQLVDAVRADDPGRLLDVAGAVARRHQRRGAPRLPLPPVPGAAGRHAENLAHWMHAHPRRPGGRTARRVMRAELAVGERWPRPRRRDRDRGPVTAQAGMTPGAPAGGWVGGDMRGDGQPRARAGRSVSGSGRRRAGTAARAARRQALAAAPERQPAMAARDGRGPTTRVGWPSPQRAVSAQTSWMCPAAGSPSNVRRARFNAPLADIESMSDTCKTITQEYVRVLNAIDEIWARRPDTWPRVQPVQRDWEAVQIDTGSDAMRLRREEVQLVSVLEQLEDTYRGLGGDLDDLHQLAKVPAPDGFA